jgi:hypothetical protein
MLSLSWPARRECRDVSFQRDNNGRVPRNFPRPEFVLSDTFYRTPERLLPSGLRKVVIGERHMMR